MTQILFLTAYGVVLLSRFLFTNNEQDIIFIFLAQKSRTNKNKRMYR